jgi:hypothetical protein
MSPDEAKEVESIERLMGRAIPRVMLPDFDYGMRPGEIKRVVSYEEEPERARKPAAGVAAAANRIASATQSKAASRGVGHVPRTVSTPRASAPRPAPARATAARGITSRRALPSAARRTATRSIRRAVHKKK